MGLKKYGKGDWRNISRNFVITRTATQVASHAQKYFIRQLSGGKDKRRASIHDITTVNLNDNDQNTPSPENKTEQHSPEQSNSGGVVRNLHFQQCSSWAGNETIMGFSSSGLGNMYASSPPYGMNGYAMKMHMQRGVGVGVGVDESSYMGSGNSMVFQMQSGFQYPNA